MKAINIYVLTRAGKAADLKRMERQMSGRNHFLTIREWEIESLKSFAEELSEGREDDLHRLRFYYSFQIPRLGKEFDLLRISEELIINVELKSEPISESGIKKQLQQNQYYLSTLGRPVRSYTYISSRKKLMRLTGGGRITETDFDTLVRDLEKQHVLYEGNIEDLFKAESYIISPLQDTERFLQKEYFLTSQQRDIERKILKNLEEGSRNFLGFTGLPGTGKTLLLYDLAMLLSVRQRICVLHCGQHTKGLQELNKRLKRIDFYKMGRGEDISFDGDYKAVLVDEAHLMTETAFCRIREYCGRFSIPAVFSYDTEDMIAREEIDAPSAQLLETLPDYEKYRLTNRIRTNEELSGFILLLMHPVRRSHLRDYPGVRIAWAKNEEERKRLLKVFESDGYTYIPCAAEADTEESKDRECSKVVMVINQQYYYDEAGYLRYRSAIKEKNQPVRKLFHGLNKAKNEMAVIVEDNEEVLDLLLTIIQGQ